MMSLFVLHAFLVRRIGISAPPAGEDEPKDWQEFRHVDYPDGQPFYPDFVAKEALAIAVYFIAMFCIIALAPAFFLPHEANSPANPLYTPAFIRPEWYFRALYEILKLIPSKLIGILFQLILISVFILWPFLDRSPRRNLVKRPLMLSVFGGTVLAWIVLTIWGSY
jgi:quinol-cytochrome oxidoreductase complex cytochrome b subunit